MGEAMKLVSDLISQQIRHTYKSPLILAQSGTSSTVTGTTAQTTLAAVVIPAGIMGLNGVLRATAFWTANNNTNVKTGGISVLGVASLFTAGLASWVGMQGIGHLRNKNSQTVNVSASNSSTGFGAHGTVSGANVNTAVDFTLSFVGTLAVPTDTMTLEGYTVELLLP